MPRFFISDSPIAGEEYILTGEDARHISKSLRMRAGEGLVLCSPENDCSCEIKSIEETAVILTILSAEKNRTEPSVRVTVYQCLPKLDKLETVIQKSTELGAVKIVPVESSRCIVKADRAGSEKKLMRLRKIALEAAKQSGRGIIPEVTALVRLPAAVKAAVGEGAAVMLYEAGGEPLKSILQSIPQESEIGIFIGPEGGFEESEIENAVNAGAKIATLGPRILRTETAAPTVLSVIMYERGELE